MKRLVFIFAFLILCAAVQANARGIMTMCGAGTGAVAANPMKQKLILSKDAAISVAATRYFPLTGSSTSAVEGRQQNVMPTSGTLRNLRVALDGSPDNGAGTQTYTIKLRKNGADINDVSCVISEAETTCQSSGSVAVAKGDLMSYSLAFGATPTSRSMSAMIEFQGNSANQVVLLGAYQEALRTDANSRYGSLHGLWVSSSEHVARAIIPVAGTITSFYGIISAAPGAGNTRVWKIYKNGAAEASSVLTFGESDTVVEVTGLSIAVNGTSDVFSVEIGGTTTPAAATGQWSAVFAPTTNGEFPIMASGTSTAIATGATKYTGQSASVLMPADDRGTNQNIGNNDYTIKGMCVALYTAPGAGKSSTFTPQTSTGDAANPSAVTISGTATSGCSTGDLTPTADEFYGTKIVNTDGAAIIPTIGYRAYIAP